MEHVNEKKLEPARCEGSKEFGFYEGEKAIIEKMRQLRADGLAYDTIATCLNNESVKPRRGAKWHPYTVSKILIRSASD